MATDFNSQISETLTSENKLTQASGRVVNFSYDDTAYNNDTVAGVASYNYNQHQNIPLGDPTSLFTDASLLDKGVRSQASSITRMLLNHMFGRTSYNVNKLADHLKTLLTIFKNFMAEGDNAYSETTAYTAGCMVYMVVTISSKRYKRVFLCTQACTNLAPLNGNGELINTSYWEELTYNFLSAGIKEDLYVGGEARFANNVVTDKNLTVKGDLIVNGFTIVTDERTISTDSNYAVLRENNPSALGSGEKAGMVIHNYAVGKNAFIGVGNDGTFRVSDNASETVHSYTNVSTYGGAYYAGLTRTTTPVVNGAVVSQDVDTLEACVFNVDTYYHYYNTKWYAVSLVTNALYFDKSSPVTDATLIATLDILTKNPLMYYRSLQVLVVADSGNQPLLTRDEASQMNNGYVLQWDATNKRAIAVLSPSALSSVSYITANSRTISGVNLSVGLVINVLFNATIIGSSLDTELTITYNNEAKQVKVMKDGSLINFPAYRIGDNYYFIQAGTPITMIWTGTYFQVVGNPVTYHPAGTGYNVRADGTIDKLEGKPVGTLWWTSKSASDGGNPNILFGGTWTQIKDRFVLCAGDTYAGDSAGGSASVALTGENIPRHNHNFTPSGSVSLSGATFTCADGGLHSHTHTLSIVPPTNASVALYVGQNGVCASDGGAVGGYGMGTAVPINGGAIADGGSHSHTVSSTSSLSLSGSQGTTSAEFGHHVSGDTYDVLAHDNMPPYVAKYCWQRTA